MFAQLSIQLSYLIGALKVLGLKFIILILAFILPIRPLILVVGLCICLDTLIGLYRSKKLKQKITSHKLSNVISKMVLYQSAILLFFCIEKYILADFIAIFTGIEWFLTKIVAATLAAIELKSINESYEVITGYSLWDKFKGFLKRGKELKNELSDFKEEE